MRAAIGKLLTRNAIQKPIFVVGIGRSGTSVLLRAIGLHPSVIPSGSEAPLIRSFGRFLYSIEHSEERDYHIESLNISRAYLYSHLRRLCFEYVVGPHYGFARLMAPASLRQERHIFGKLRWCAKTFPTLKEYQGLRLLFPDVKLVYIIRNGLDVVYSRTRFPGFKHLDFSSHCQTWADSVKVFHYLTGLENAIQVRHEDLVEDPEGLFTRVFDFLALPQHPEPVSFVKTNQMIPLDKPSLEGIDVKATFEARKPPHEGWSREQRTTFKAIAGDAMRRSGYEVPF